MPLQLLLQMERTKGTRRRLEPGTRTGERHLPDSADAYEDSAEVLEDRGQDEKTQPPTACLDYALDDQPAAGAKGDGLIVVDEGFIRMTSTDSSLDPTKPGVRVRTRKVVGFANWALTPWGVLACSMGYGDQGIDMILDGVENRMKNSQGWTDWKASTAPPAKSPGQPKDKPPQEPPTNEPDTSRRAVELAVEMVNECVEDMSRRARP